MQNPRSILIGITFLLISVGCQEQNDVGSVEIIRGFSAYQPKGTSIVQENDHCFILAVDGHHVDPPNEDQGYTDAHTISYRQFEVPPGSHTITVRFYRHVSRSVVETSGLSVDVDTDPPAESGVHLGPIKLPVKMAPQHTYVLSANYTSFADTSIAPHWQPELVDHDTHQSAGKATLQ
jgi:hypothetical protein